MLSPCGWMAGRQRTAVSAAVSTVRGQPEPGVDTSPAETVCEVNRSLKAYLTGYQSIDRQGSCDLDTVVKSHRNDHERDADIRRAPSFAACLRRTSGTADAPGADPATSVPPTVLNAWKAATNPGPVPRPTSEHWLSAPSTRPEGRANSAYQAARAAAVALEVDAPSARNGAGDGVVGEK